jgi:hypothetical protein
MNRETAGENALDLAVKRLESAIGMLEQRLAQRLAEAGAQAAAKPVGLSDDDRAKLSAELAQARARERQLEEAGAEASAALGRAIVEIRAALNGADQAQAREG